MKRVLRTALYGSAVLALSLGVAACGSSGKKSSTSGGAGTSQGKQGGKLTALYSADIDFLDPGQTYYQVGYGVQYAVNRPLYSYKPDDSVNAVPDLADGPPVISADRKTITVKIKKGVKFSPPVNREVTSKDVEYAFDRALSKNVPNQYTGLYFTSLVGYPAKPGPIQQIPGITTPDDSTIVFKLSKPAAVYVSQALAMPISVPVPKEYAAPFDAKAPSTYDKHVVFTGPYMVKSDASGANTGWQPGKSIDLVRNPNWVKSTDYRPAPLDEIFIQEGNTNSQGAARKALDGTSTVCCDGNPPKEVLAPALQSAQKDQIASVPSGGTRYIAINTTIPPFNNVNLRKAILASMDRNALLLTRGGAFIGPIAGGWLPPGMPGFEEGGGLKQNTDFDFLANPTGDAAVARKYMDAAQKDGLQIQNGKWIGGGSFLAVADNSDPGKSTAENFQQQMVKLGFKIDLHEVPHSAMYTTFCQVPAKKVVFCPNVGWFKDFSDPQSMLQVTFNGRTILPVGNNNWPQLNVPAINDAMDKAALLPAGPERNKAWADINHSIAAEAPAIPWVWDSDFNAGSKNVNQVMNGYTGVLDLAYTSLK